MTDPPDLLGDEVLGFDGSGRDAGHMEAEDLLLPVRDGGGVPGGTRAPSRSFSATTTASCRPRRSQGHAF